MACITEASSHCSFACSATFPETSTSCSITRASRSSPSAVHSRGELADGFRRLGVATGDTVMLHASVKAVGEVAGGPDEIHLALKDALTPEGTLVMYASCPQYTDEIGRGNLTPERERELLEKLPPFD